MWWLGGGEGPGERGWSGETLGLQREPQTQTEENRVSKKIMTRLQRSRSLNTWRSPSNRQRKGRN